MTSLQISLRSAYETTASLISEQKTDEGRGTVGSVGSWMRSIFLKKKDPEPEVEETPLVSLIENPTIGHDYGSIIYGAGKANFGSDSAADKYDDVEMGNNNNSSDLDIGKARYEGLNGNKADSKQSESGSDIIAAAMNKTVFGSPYENKKIHPADTKKPDSSALIVVKEKERERLTPLLRIYSTQQIYKKIEDAHKTLQGMDLNRVYGSDLLSDDEYEDSADSATINTIRYCNTRGSSWNPMTWNILGGRQRNGMWRDPVCVTWLVDKLENFLNWMMGSPRPTVPRISQNFSSPEAASSPYYRDHTVALLRNSHQYDLTSASDSPNSSQNAKRDWRARRKPPLPKLNTWEDHRFYNTGIGESSIKKREFENMSRRMSKVVNLSWSTGWRLKLLTFWFPITITYLVTAGQMIASIVPPHPDPGRNWGCHYLHTLPFQWQRMFLIPWPMAFALAIGSLLRFNVRGPCESLIPVCLICLNCLSGAFLITVSIFDEMPGKAGGIDEFGYRGFSKYHSGFGTSAYYLVEIVRDVMVLTMLRDIVILRRFAAQWKKRAAAKFLLDVAEMQSEKTEDSRRQALAVTIKKREMSEKSINRIRWAFSISTVASWCLVPIVIREVNYTGLWEFLGNIFLPMCFPVNNGIDFHANFFKHMVSYVGLGYMASCSLLALLLWS